MTDRAHLPTVSLPPSMSVSLSMTVSIHQRRRIVAPVFSLVVDISQLGPELMTPRLNTKPRLWLYVIVELTWLIRRWWAIIPPLVHVRLMFISIPRLVIMIIVPVLPIPPPLLSPSRSILASLASVTVSTPPLPPRPSRVRLRLKLVLLSFIRPPTRLAMMIDCADGCGCEEETKEDEVGW